MKKRLLSAALAFAMVLTLIPATMLTAFAAVEYQAIGTAHPNSVIKSQTLNADGTVKETRYYYEDVTNANGVRTITTVNVQRFTGGNDGTNRQYGEWYWLDNRDSQHPRYYKVSSGIIAGNNGSGQWYPDLNAFTTTTFNATTNVTTKALRSTTFTVLSTSVNMSGSSATNYWTSTTLNVDMEGSGATLVAPDNLVSLTVTSKFMTTHACSVTIPSTNRTLYNAGNSGVTLNATNVNVGTINLNGRANNVTLNGCLVGNITLNGNYLNSATAVAPNYTWASQSLTTGSNTKIDGAIVINGDNNNVKIADTDATGQTLSVTGSGNVAISGLTYLSDITASARGTSGAYATVSVSGGSVGRIIQGTVAGNNNSITVNVSNTNTHTGAITVDKGTVNLTSGNVNGDVTVNAGALNATQDGVHVSGTLFLGDTDVTSLNLSATSSTYGGIKVNKGANLKITGWNNKRWLEGNGSKYGTLNLNDYTGKGVTGGSFDDTMTFPKVKEMKWLGPDVQFYVKNDKTVTVDLYNADELARAISDITTAKAADPDNSNIIVVGQTAVQNIVLKNGQNTWARIGYNTTTGLILPESINGMKIAQWYSPANHNIILTSGTVQGVPIGTADLELNASGVTAEAKKITNVVVSQMNPVSNGTIRVALNGNNIALSGAVEVNAGNISTIYVDLITDAIDKNGSPIMLKTVAIDYYPNTKQVKFNMIQPSVNDAGGVIQEQGAKLVLNNGTGEIYTVSANLSVSAETLGFYYGFANDTSPIVVTFGGKLSGWSSAEKQELIKQIQNPQNPNSGYFSINDNRAVLEAVNAAQATITSDSSVANWVTTAKNNVWRNGYKSSNTDLNKANGGFAVSGSASLTPNSGNFNNTSATGIEIAKRFQKAYVVPYLVMNITDYDRNGALTATLTPYYRVDISGATYDPDFYYTAQTGAALSALTGAMCPNGIKINLSGLPAAFRNLKMHQDGKYVYTGVGGEWTITHAGTNGNGFGTIVINNLDGKISMTSSIVGRFPSIADLGCTYDTLQAAIDDTVRGAVIQTNPGGAEVTGVLVPGETMDTILVDGDYTGSCAITMTGAARKVQINAQGQQEVTVTGANVSVDKFITQIAGGYVYAVELKRDNVTVAGNVAISVSASTLGTASVSATSVKAGQTVTVTLTPNVGATATGVTIKTNTGAAVSATPTGTANQYSFTVPTGVTSITVTPAFSAKVTSSTLPFTDVKTTDSFYSAVKWNYDNNFVKGTTETTFRPYNDVTRAQIVTILYRHAGSPAVSYSVNPYTDMTSDSEMNRAIVWATQNKIVEGYGNGKFGSNNSVRNQELAKILYTYNTYRGKTSTVPNSVNLSTYFNDASSISSWAVPYVKWAVGNGVMSAASGKQYQPQLQLQRWLVAVDTYNYGLMFGA